MFINLKKIFLITVALFFTSSISLAENGYLKINYGISAHDSRTTTTNGTITTDDEDEGFIFSFGSMIGTNWGIDAMYYDLGTSYLASLDVGDQFKIDGNNYAVETAGTISHDVSGFGTGLVFATNNEASEYLSVDSYIKIGVHAWDHGGSTTILDNDNAFAGSYYTQGIGGYGGVGVAFNLYDNMSLDLAYDIIGLGKEANFDNSSSLLSAGLRIKY